jgi:hypothetical protein
MIVLKKGMRVRIKNIDKLWHPEHDTADIEFWSQIIGLTGITTSNYDSEYYYRDDEYFDYDDNYTGDEDMDIEDNRTREYAHCINVIHPTEGETQVYLFSHNFVVIPNEPPKDDIEWLDRVQQNFKF